MLKNRAYVAKVVRYIFFSPRGDVKEFLLDRKMSFIFSVDQNPAQMKLAVPFIPIYLFPFALHQIGLGLLELVWFHQFRFGPRSGSLSALTLSKGFTSGPKARPNKNYLVRIQAAWNPDQVLSDIFSRGNVAKFD